MADVSDFERSALPHLDAAFTLAFWLVRNRPDADDVVQDAYLRAFRAFAGFRGDDIKPWLLTIVRNVAYRALENRRRNGNVISFDDPAPRAGSDADFAASLASDTPSAEDILIGHGERAMVLAAIAELAPAHREIIVLREMEDLSYRAIADVTGVPIGTVMSRLARARGELKTLLSRRLEKEDGNAL